MFSDNVESGAAQIDKVVETLRWTFTSVYHISHVRGQNERGSIPEIAF